MIGQRLSHYLIEEQIGAGGMGVVYRAHDEQLDRDVAIKVLPKGSVADETAQKRFRKEALSLARLNHPNIATVHEFGSQDGIDFLVTEYIAGITLDTKLARGPLPPPEIVRLGLQLAAGLAAAHHQGIVHRDLKPGNLRITTDGRLKILDFGLAQFVAVAHGGDLGMTATATMTKSQETSGTLPYMSPEQLSGQAADASSDIWAAGTVLYEMATGKRPFPQKVPALMINAILNQAPEPPSKLSPVPPELENVILKALERDPVRRYRTAEDLGADLERTVASTSTAAVPVTPKKNVQFPVAAAVLIVALAVGGYFYLHRSRQAASGPLAPPRRSVAVLGFKNLSANPEKSWLSTALSEMLTTELSQGDQLRTIPGESVAQMKANLALPDADSFSQQTLTRIRQNLGSDNVVVGSYVFLGNGLLRLDVRLQDAVAGETLASVSEKGNETEIDSLVGKAGAELRAKLGVGALSDAQSAQVRASMPANAEAARLYSEGLQRLRVFDALAARDALEKAAAVDPKHAPTHSTLAEAWFVLGYDEKAKDQAKLALDLSSKASQSSREERLLIEGRAHELMRERPEAIESYRALWGFFPDNIDYGLFLIRAQIAGGHAADAENVLSQLHKLPASDGDTARIDLAEAAVASALSDFKRQQSAAERAASRSRAAGATLLVAESLQLEAEAWERMGQSQKTIDELHQAHDLFASAGNRQGAARTVVAVGDLLFDQGDYEGAKKQFEDALKVFQELGARKGIRGCYERIGNVYYGEGRMHESLKPYQRVLDFDLETNDAVGLASDYGNMANALDGLGELKEALKMQQQSLDAFNQIGDRRGSSATINNLGNLYVEMGDFEQARKYFDQSLKLSREISYKRGEPYPLSGLGDVSLAQGDLEGATTKYQEALALCKEMNDEDFAAQLNVGLAVVALAEKRFADGANLAGQAAGVYEKSNVPANAAWAEAIRARNLLGAGNLAEAQPAAAKALTLSRQGSSETPRYEAAMAAARVKARQGKAAEGLKQLEPALTSAKKFGYRHYEYQIRLALAEIELSSGSPAARGHLASVEKDARQQGALLVANQARALLGGEAAKSGSQ
ncbi:MAG TPA: protein kinase [Candidatus Solibacter sp.]|nr:protein kinase [Candidatus Solibacter sp.]